MPIDVTPGAPPSFGSRQPASIRPAHHSRPAPPNPNLDRNPNPPPTKKIKIRRAGLLAILFTFAFASGASGQAITNSLPPALLQLEGRVEISRAGAIAWETARTNQLLHPGDRVRTGPRSRAVIRLSPTTTKRLGDQTIIQMPPPTEQGRGVKLLKGILYFFHRDQPGTFPVQTPSAYAVVLGTEFTVEVDDAGATTLHLIDGNVALTNAQGRLDLRSGESASAAPGQPPRRAPALETVRAVQWCLYYPAVLDPEELRFTPEERTALAESLIAYRSGDLLAALARWPDARPAASDAERVYLAALLLSVGHVTETESLLATLPARSPVNPQAEALRLLITAVRSKPSQQATANASATLNSPLSTTLLAFSYFAQSEARLDAALAAARAATERSPMFGFAWARVAELEFSFGRTDAANAALAEALRLAPRHAAAHAVQGFVFAGQNRLRSAMDSFETAIALDGALGNAWLGRGLCRIRLGDAAAGRADLQIAATLEPQRALLRSYLAKALGDAPRDAGGSRDARAAHELELAKQLDPADPTAWLYSALLNQRRNRVNDAVRDAEHSQALNDNRRVYRSRLLLDADSAVRSVNLAQIYADAGLADVAAREAGRAVAADPANYSAHLFLGHSYQARRDLRGVSQRYETPAVTEFLLANLLAPVGAGTLAQSVSQQEYSRLFESDGAGVASATEYSSRGRWLESAAQYGTYGNSAYALSAYYDSDPGQRRNHDSLQQEYSLQLKQQVTPKDSVYVRASYGEAAAGDVIPRYDPASAIPGLRVRETLEPLLLAGWHHEWGPGAHSLLLGGWFKDDARVRNPQQGVLVEQREVTGTTVLPISIGQQYRNEAEAFTVEAQQFWQGDGQSLILGARWQGGGFTTRNQHTNASFLPFLFPNAPQHVATEFERWSAYGYYDWRPVETLLLSGGLSYDWLRFPENFRFAPLSSGEDKAERLLPKAGLVWTPAERTTVRAGWAQSLGGVGLEQSLRLEPTQIAGFNQSFRSIIPEALAGANAAAAFTSAGAAVEQRLGAGTFLSLEGEWLESRVDRRVGIYQYDSFVITPGATREKLDYRERTLAFTLHQLVGAEWSFGARYRVSRAELEDRYVQIPRDAAVGGTFRPRSEQEAWLHQVSLDAIYQHSSGFFAQAQALWTRQSHEQDSSALPDADFWQFNAWAGWRFAQRRVEARVGLLNIGDRDYRLHPLNLVAELPRHRTLVVGLKFNF